MPRIPLLRFIASPFFGILCFLWISLVFTMSLWIPQSSVGMLLVRDWYFPEMLSYFLQKWNFHDLLHSTGFKIGYLGLFLNLVGQAVSRMTGNTSTKPLWLLTIGFLFLGSFFWTAPSGVLQVNERNSGKWTVGGKSLHVLDWSQDQVLFRLQSQGNFQDRVLTSGSPIRVGKVFYFFKSSQEEPYWMTSVSVKNESTEIIQKFRRVRIGEVYPFQTPFSFRVKKNFSDQYSVVLLSKGRTLKAKDVVVPGPVFFPAQKLKMRIGEVRKGSTVEVYWMDGTLWLIRLVLWLLLCLGLVFWYRRGDRGQV